MRISNNTVQADFLGIGMYNVAGGELGGNDVRSLTAIESVVSTPMLIRDNIIRGTEVGLDLTGPHEIANNDIADGDDGIRIAGAVLIHGNTIRRTTTAIDLTSVSAPSALRTNMICRNDIGIRWADLRGVKISDNAMSNIRNAERSSTPPTTVDFKTLLVDGTGGAWSEQKTPGRNIVGGPFLGGNWWSDYAGADFDGDGIGETPHEPLPQGQLTWTAADALTSAGLGDESASIGRGPYDQSPLVGVRPTACET